VTEPILKLLVLDKVVGISSRINRLPFSSLATPQSSTFLVSDRFVAEDQSGALACLTPRALCHHSAKEPCVAPRSAADPRDVFLYAALELSSNPITCWRRLHFLLEILLCFGRSALRGLACAMLRSNLSLAVRILLRTPSMPGSRYCSRHPLAHCPARMSQTAAPERTCRRTVSHALSVRHIRRVRDTSDSRLLKPSITRRSITAGYSPARSTRQNVFWRAGTSLGRSTRRISAPLI